MLWCHACLVPSHYLNWHCVSVDHLETTRNKLQSNLINVIKLSFKKKCSKYHLQNINYLFLWSWDINSIVAFSQNPFLACLAHQTPCRRMGIQILLCIECMGNLWKMPFLTRPPSFVILSMVYIAAFNVLGYSSGLVVFVMLFMDSWWHICNGYYTRTTLIMDLKKSVYVLSNY